MLEDLQKHRITYHQTPTSAVEVREVYMYQTFHLRAWFCSYSQSEEYKTMATYDMQAEYDMVTHKYQETEKKCSSLLQKSFTCMWYYIWGKVMHMFKDRVVTACKE